MDKIIYICQYLGGSCQKASGMAHAETMMKEGFKPTIRTKNAILLCAYSVIASMSKKDLMENVKYPFLIKWAYPAGKLVAIYWKWKHMG